MKILDTIKSFIKTTSVTSENFSTHLTRWFTHTRAGGLIPYRGADFEELKKVNLIYREFIGINDKDQRLNNVLDIDWAKSQPEAKEHEIHKCFIFEAQANKGPLKNGFSCIFNFVRACVNERFESIATQGYNHVNGAIVLFCAEFAQWINSCSKRPIDKFLLVEVETRWRYLLKIESEEVFSEEAKTNYSIYLLILNIRVLLQQVIKPEIEASLSQETSREHFKNLASSSQNFFENVVKAIFYCFTSYSTLPDIFSFQSNSLITNDQLKKALETHLGDLFKKLQNVHDKSGSGQYIENSDSNNIFQEFNNEEGYPHEILINQLMNGSDGRRSGIHDLMKKTNIIQLLVHVMGLLSDFSMLIHGFKQAYSLGGMGGDIMLYIALCQETTEILICFSQITTSIKRDLHDISSYIEEIHLDLSRKQEKNPWRKICSRSFGYFNQATKELLECEMTVSQILFSMQRVLSQNYEHEVKSKIQQFKNTVQYLKKRTQSLSLSPTKGLENLSYRTALAPSDDKSIEALLQMHKQTMNAYKSKFNTNETILVNRK